MTKEQLEQQVKELKELLNHSYRIPVEINEDVYILDTSTKTVYCRFVDGYKIGDGFGVMELNDGKELQYWYEGGEDHLGAYEEFEKIIKTETAAYKVFFTLDELKEEIAKEPNICFYGEPGYGSWEELLGYSLYPKIHKKNIFESYTTYHLANNLS